MKILLKLFLVFLAMLFIAGPTMASLLYEIEECNADGTSADKWECLKQDGIWDEKDFEATVRYGNQVEPAQTWELSIKDPGVPVQVDGEMLWKQFATNYFEFSYDSHTGAIDLYVESTPTPAGPDYIESLNLTYDTYKAFDYVAIIAKGSDDPDNNNLWNLEINGIGLPGVNTQALEIYSGVRIFMDDALQQDGFLLTGNFDFVWTGPTANEIPGFQIFAMNTHDLERVPEPGTFMLLGFGILGLAGLTVRRRFKK